MKKGSIRLQLDVTPEITQEIKETRDLMGLPTTGQFILCGITLLFWAVKEILRGRAIGSYDGVTENFYQITTPGFANIEAKVKHGLHTSQEVKKEMATICLDQPNNHALAGASR